jgi:YbgC/YbaW family acyl-CoA thioester hydrolase
MTIQISDSKPFVIKVSFSEIDFVGRIFYSRIYEFAQRVFENFLKKTSLISLKKITNNEQSLPVIVHCQASYFSPIVMDDELLTTIVCKHIGRTSFTLFYTFFKKQKNKKTKMATAEIVHVFIAYNNKPKKITPIWKDILNTIKK